MLFKTSRIEGVVVIELEKREDTRGYFARAWCEQEFLAHGLPRFVQTNMSMCRDKGTIRGFHYQIAPHGEAKYMRCIRGAIFDQVIDIRPRSPTYMQSFGVELNAENRSALFVAAGLAHAYQALTDDCEVIYSASSPYAPGFERGIRWNDPAFDIAWPVKNVILSDKDAQWADFGPELPL